jgi:hypothetical protein
VQSGAVLVIAVVSSRLAIFVALVVATRLRSIGRTVYAAMEEDVSVQDAVICAGTGTLAGRKLRLLNDD